MVGHKDISRRSLRLVVRGPGNDDRAQLQPLVEPQPSQR
jgi:hypothetical protein